jgi:hypothetical protein
VLEKPVERKYEFMLELSPDKCFATERLCGAVSKGYS